MLICQVSQSISFLNQPTSSSSANIDLLVGLKVPFFTHWNKSRKLNIPQIGNEPLDERKSFKFPLRSFGQKNKRYLAFNPHWFNTWNGLHYCETTDSVFWHLCVKAYAEKKLKTENLGPSYISSGYTNWKEAHRRFNSHEKSNCHQEAILKITYLPD